MYKAGLLTNTMDILVDTAVRDTRQVEVDDVHHILDVESPSRNTSGNQDGRFSSAESSADEEVSRPVQNINAKLLYLHGVLTLSLGPSGMNRGARQSHVVQVVIKQIRLVLVVDENQGA
jgi:hypothetical protein